MEAYFLPFTNQTLLINSESKHRELREMLQLSYAPFFPGCCELAAIFSCLSVTVWTKLDELLALTSHGVLAKEHRSGLCKKNHLLFSYLCLLWSLHF